MGVGECAGEGREAMGHCAAADVQGEPLATKRVHGVEFGATEDEFSIGECGFHLDEDSLVALGPWVTGETSFLFFLSFFLPLEKTSRVTPNPLTRMHRKMATA